MLLSKLLPVNLRIMIGLLQTIFTNLREHMVSPTESIFYDLSLLRSSLIGILPQVYENVIAMKRLGISTRSGNTASKDEHSFD